MQLLPVVEMFCKWILEEDCSNLHQLMLRCDDERELESHELGRSLLSMIRDDNADLEMLPRPIRIDPPSNPFEVIRAGLAAVEVALRGLRPQVHVVMGFLFHVTFGIKQFMAFLLDILLDSVCHSRLCPAMLSSSVHTVPTTTAALPCAPSFVSHPWCSNFELSIIARRTL